LWKGQAAPTAACLQLVNHQFPIDALEGDLYPQDTRLQGDYVERIQAVAPDHFQEATRLFGGEEEHLLPCIRAAEVAAFDLLHEVVPLERMPGNLLTRGVLRVIAWPSVPVHEQRCSAVTGRLPNEPSQLFDTVIPVPTACDLMPLIRRCLREVGEQIHASLQTSSGLRLDQ
jgi:hypothetical protein